MKTIAIIITGFLISCDRSMNDSWINPPSCHKKDCFEKASAGSINQSPGDYHEPEDYP